MAVRNEFPAVAFGLVALFGSALDALAQAYPVPPAGLPAAQQQLCTRLEGQLAAIERGAPDPARAAQTARVEDAIRAQRSELDQVVARAQRIGCRGSGFFSLFSGQPAECGPLNHQIQQRHAAIDRLMLDLQRLQGTTADREIQRRSVLIALADNDCGPQYRAVVARRSRGLFESLFGPGAIMSPDRGPPQSGTFRTVCVRSCDGYYWPISFSTVPSRFSDDERSCQRMCPAAQVSLFAYRNPGEDISQAVSIDGRPYTETPNAFAYRRQLDPACSCRRPGETWAGALRHLDDTIEQGDIVVTEERAKQLSRPRETPASRLAPARRDGEQASPPPAQPAAGDGKAPERTIRQVGPTFLPAR